MKWHTSVIFDMHNDGNDSFKISAITWYPEYFIIIDIENSAWTYLKYHVRQGGNVALNQS